MPASKVVEKMGRAAQRERLVREVLDKSWVTFLNEDSLTVSASIAYFAMLSFFPMMLLLVSLSGVYIRHYELNGELTIVLEGFLPMKPDFIMRELVDISQAFGRVTLISCLLLLWSSSGIFLPLEKALNRAWEVQTRRKWWQSYLVALQMALMFGAFIAVYMGLVGVNFYLHGRLDYWVARYSMPALAELVYRILYVALTFAMTLVMFTILFQRLPNRQLGSREVLPSAFVTALLWEATRIVFTHLLPVFNYNHVYGSIGAVVALMTWLYVSSAVTLFGAHVSNALYRTLKMPAAVQAPPIDVAVQPVPDPR